MYERYNDRDRSHGLIQEVLREPERLEPISREGSRRHCRYRRAAIGWLVLFQRSGWKRTKSYLNKTFNCYLIAKIKRMFYMSSFRHLPSLLGVEIATVFFLLWCVQCKQLKKLCSRWQTPPKKQSAQVKCRFIRLWSFTRQQRQRCFEQTGARVHTQAVRGWNKFQQHIFNFKRLIKDELLKKHFTTFHLSHLSLQYCVKLDHRHHRWINFSFKRWKCKNRIIYILFKLLSLLLTLTQSDSTQCCSGCDGCWIFLLCFTLTLWSCTRSWQTDSDSYRKSCRQGHEHHQGVWTETGAQMSPEKWTILAEALEQMCPITQTMLASENKIIHKHTIYSYSYSANIPKETLCVCSSHLFPFVFCVWLKDFIKCDYFGK